MPKLAKGLLFSVMKKVHGGDIGLTCRGYTEPSDEVIGVINTGNNLSL